MRRQTDSSELHCSVGFERDPTTDLHMYNKSKYKAGACKERREIVGTVTRIRTGRPRKVGGIAVRVKRFVPSAVCPERILGPTQHPT
jgi:hypothetical protein